MKTIRRLLPILVLLVLAAAALSFDLANRGAAWRWFWSLTGEEEPFAQVRGMVEYAGNFIRPQPRTAALTAINHTDVPPYGINTFLQQEVEIAKRERTLAMIAEAGFSMIRQQFPWEDIEIHARGDFSDRRNDLNGDGVIDERDAVSAWDKYDNIVALAEQYGITIQARLDNPPAWTHADPAIGSFAPPDDLQDYINFAVAVAERYRGRIRYYQIWNEPNIYPEWGEQPVSPEGYTEMLCRTYAALKAVDPAIVVISGPLSPTVSLTDRNLSDFIFLERMYVAGAGACFDVMSAQGYGFFSGPTDRRMRPMTLNFARHLYIRDIMVAHGDAAKPIWISEAAWNPQPEDPSIVTSQYGNFGIVTEEQAGRYMPLGYQRAQEEWPWIGNISYWFFKRAADYERNQAFYYFRMVEPDFTPLPVYDAMKQYITTQQPVLFPGVHQAEDWAIERPQDAELHTIPAASFGQALTTPSVAFRAQGSDLIVRWRSENGSQMAVNWAALDAAGELVGLPIVAALVPSTPGAWNETHLRLPAYGRYLINLDFAVDDNVFEGDLDWVLVADRSYENTFPMLAAVVIGVGFALVVLLGALRERLR
ncbi:MAG: hypothetical protein JNJ61_26340 [Anaerolineae bacterium]|nr:hypothetical protein [Anaerolineae bacterium]